MDDVNVDDRLAGGIDADAGAGDAWRAKKLRIDSLLRIQRALDAVTALTDDCAEATATVP